MIAWKKVIDNKTVNADGSITSDPIDVCVASTDIGLKVKVESGSAPDVRVDYQVSDSGMGDADLVGGAEDVKNGISWETPETGGTLINSITSGSKKDGCSIMPSNWIRIRVVGIGANGADTKITVHVALDE